MDSVTENLLIWASWPCSEPNCDVTHDNDNDGDVDIVFILVIIQNSKRILQKKKIPSEMEVAPPSLWVF